MAYTESALYIDSVAYAAITAWATGAKTVGQIRRQAITPAVGSERCFVCIVAGTSGGTEPATWNITRGAKTTDNTVTWMEVTGLPALNGDSANTSAWHASAGAIALGALIKNVAATHYFICTTAGTGGTGSEPSWSTTAGTTTTDGSVTWTCLGAISSFTTAWAAAAARLTLPLTSGSAWIPNAGMNIYIGDDHAETSSSSTTYGGGITNALTNVLCVDHTVALPPTSSNLKTTATLTTTSTGTLFFGPVTAEFYVYGLQLIHNGTAAALQIVSANGPRITFERSTFNYAAATASARILLGNSAAGGMIECRNCTFNLSAATQSIAFLACSIKLEGCSFTGTSAVSPMFSGNASFGTIIVEGSDLSLCAGGTLYGSGPSAQYGQIIFKDCIVPAISLAYKNGDAGMWDGQILDINRCDSGGTAYRNERHARFGTQTTSTAIVRTGGASDGATPVSHQVVTTTNAAFVLPFNPIPLVIWNGVTGSNRNVTLYGVANDSRVPNNDEFWFDVEYLGSGASSQGSFSRGSKSNVLAAGSALTADSSSAWDSAATARANSHAYVLGDIIKLASNPTRIFFCTTAGTSASSEPGGYATAVDGGSVTDGGAVFRAGCRFKQTLTLSSPQPGQVGYLYVYPKFGRASFTYFLDPKIELS